HSPITFSTLTLLYFLFFLLLRRPPRSTLFPCTTLFRSLDDSAVNLREFEVWINFRLDGDEVAFAPEQFEERAEISVHAAASKSQGARMSKRVRLRRERSRF